ncbi:hypothetical protein D3C84_951490 [compost metagenome]
MSQRVIAQIQVIEFLHLGQLKGGLRRECDVAMLKRQNRQVLHSKHRVRNAAQSEVMDGQAFQARETLDETPGA